MISTSIHGITNLTISEPELHQNIYGAGNYAVRKITMTTNLGKCTIDLFGESLAALTATESAEADYWRTQAAEESARADEAESLAVEWRDKHETLYLRAEKDRQRADSAEQRLAALQDLLYKACDASGEQVQGSGVQP